MLNHSSLLNTLKRRFIFSAIVGSALVLAVELANYSMWLGEARNRLGVGAMLHEVTEHVVIPTVLILLPFFLLTIASIRASFNRIVVASQRIEAAAIGDRGVRIASGDLPAEIQPLVASVNRLLARLDEAAERQQNYAADAAHELRTPLTILGLELDRIDDPRLPPLRAEVRAMGELLDKLLVMAQLDAVSTSREPPEMFDVAALAEETVKRFQSLAQFRGRTLRFEHRGSASTMGHRQLALSALHNLVENAIEATPEGTEVLVWASADGKVAVRDRGPGVSPRDLEVLTQRFVRADRKPRGAGLGLSIAFQIMKLHNGRLYTDPEAREFVLAFPVSGQPA
jgi:signal transduction histidine kinase